MQRKKDLAQRRTLVVVAQDISCEPETALAIVPRMWGSSTPDQELTVVSQQAQAVDDHQDGATFVADHTQGEW